ncbi:MAG: hypothetical protein IJE27_02260 [Anaerotignum sp.]|nr:hypothetical protein [Anaerotignum sp.]
MDKVLEEKKMIPICQVTKREKHKSIRRGISFLMDWLWDKTSAGESEFSFLSYFFICVRLPFHTKRILEKGGIDGTPQKGVVV